MAVLRQAIFDEFNTLSVVYQQPAALFVQAAQYQLHEDHLEQPQVREWWQVAGQFGSSCWSPRAVSVDEPANPVKFGCWIQHKNAVTLASHTHAPTHARTNVYAPVCVAFGPSPTAHAGGSVWRCCG